MRASTNLPPKFIDLFAGCGGLSLGLTRGGWQGVFAVENDSFAFETFSHNLLQNARNHSFAWPKWLDQKPISILDLEKEHSENLLRLRGEIDLVAGGPPCQGFSTAGRRQAHDPRNSLVQSYVSIVRIVRPKIILLENVRGLTMTFSYGDITNYAEFLYNELSNEYHIEMDTIKLSLWGVPQNRTRFFLVGVRKDAFENTNLLEYIKQYRTYFLTQRRISPNTTARSAISDLEVSINGQKLCDECSGYNSIDYHGPLTSYQKLMNAETGNLVSDTRLAKHTDLVKKRFERIIEDCHKIGWLNKSINKEMRTKYGLSKQATRVLDPDSPAPTVTSMPDDLLHYSEPRTLTVRENARLQSFPDFFEFKGKYTSGGNRRSREVPRFTQVANAVPPLVAEGFGEAILRFLRSEARRDTEQKGLNQVADEDVAATRKIVPDVL